MGRQNVDEMSRYGTTTRDDPALFFRTHRSVIVRLDRIETILRAAGGDYAVRLKSGVRLKVSRSRLEELEQRMGISG